MSVLWLPGGRADAHPLPETRARFGQHLVLPNLRPGLDGRQASAPGAVPRRGRLSLEAPPGDKRSLWLCHAHDTGCVVHLTDGSPYEAQDGAAAPTTPRRCRNGQRDPHQQHRLLERGVGARRPSRSACLEDRARPDVNGDPEVCAGTNSETPKRGGRPGLSSLVSGLAGASDRPVQRLHR